MRSLLWFPTTDARKSTCISATIMSRLSLLIVFVHLKMKLTSSLLLLNYFFPSLLLFYKSDVSLALLSAVKVKDQVRSTGKSSRYIVLPVCASKRQESSTTEFSLTRRSAVQQLLTAASFPYTFFSGRQALAETSSSSSPVAELPMQNIRLPKGAVGRDYVLIKLKVQGQGPFDFMLDSGLTTDLITPHLQKFLGIQETGATMTGVAAGGDNTATLVKLSDASLCCGSFASGKTEMPLPTLSAIVSDFPQEHLDPAHDPVEGMLGMEMLQLFDADFDFPKGKLRLWSPGTALPANKGLVEIPAAVLNEGLLGIRLIGTEQAYAQPMVGIIDCGSSLTIMNWAAADMLGLPRDENAYRNNPSILGVGVDGRPQRMPTTKTQFTFCGDAYSSSSGKIQFSPPPKNWKPWDPVTVGIGDLPAFAELLGDGKTPYKGPAVLVGLDVLSQRRVILETGNGRARRLAVAPSA